MVVVVGLLGGRSLYLCIVNTSPFLAFVFSFSFSHADAGFVCVVIVIFVYQACYSCWHSFYFLFSWEMILDCFDLRNNVQNFVKKSSDISTARFKTIFFQI